MNWEAVIGLEVHVQLGTRSKMFCGCSVEFGGEPNTNVCPVCLGLPGALPVTNREAVRLAVRAALALDCTVHPESVFARKSYFYPDLPKGYQISQFDRPLATSGRLTISSPLRDEVAVGINRLHLEEDAGKSLHDRIPGKTAIDFNRSGTPLVEIVSEPELFSAAEARVYLLALKQILEYLGVSDCNMEEGRLRVDANLSVRPVGRPELGVKQEVKNMNSFSAMEGALAALQDRQIRTLEEGGSIELATFSAATGELRKLRAKEEAQDYRYFTEPDLPPLVLAEDWLSEARESLPELPAARRARFEEQYGVRPYDAEVLSSTRELADYFELVTGAGADAKAAANWVMGSVLKDVNANRGQFRVSPSRLAELIAMTTDGTVSNQAAKRIFAELPGCDDQPRALARRLGLVQVADEDQVSAWIEAVLERHPNEVVRYRGGESRLLDFFMGRVMRESGGKADPKRVQALLRQRLN